MRRTLVFIPHEIAGLPVLGFGWLLIFICAALIIRLVWAKRGGRAIASILAAEGVMWGVVIAAVALILPVVELKNVAGEPVGMAIRGYGVMLLAGVASSVALAAYRAKRRGIDPEVILSMAPWVFVGGMVGARLFYVIQYRDSFMAETLGQTIRNMVAFTEGGLVVYGSFIGGFIAASVFIAKHHLPLLKLGDVIVPCMFLGVFFGRIGCLMNGCCYGGRCEDGWSAMHFPVGSAVYRDQVRDGDLLGLSIHPVSREIEQVRVPSLAAKAGLQVGSKVDLIAEDQSYRAAAPPDVPLEDAPTGVIATVDGRRYRWSPEELPPLALPVHAAQLFSSISALALCLVLCAISHWRPREGTVMMLGFAGYATIRFGLEIVRVDEAGQFGTSFSISQWVSIVVFIVSIAALIWIFCRARSVDVAS